MVVTVGFRVGVLGHLASNSLRERSDDGSAGNWGIQVCPGPGHTAHRASTF